MLTVVEDAPPEVLAQTVNIVVVMLTSGVPEMTPSVKFRSVGQRGRDGPVADVAAADGRRQRAHRLVANQRDVVRVVGQVDRRLKHRDVDPRRGAAARGVGVDEVLRLGHVHERRAAEHTVGEVQPFGQDAHERPFADVAARNGGVQRLHGRAAHQRQVVRVVEQVNHRLEDGDVDGGRRRTARVVGVNREHGRRQVDRWRTADDAVAEVQAVGQGGMDGPVLHRTAAVGRMEVGHRHAAGEGDVVRRVGEVARGLQDGDVDRVACSTARGVGPHGEHAERHVDRWRTADDAVAEVEAGWQVGRDGPVGDVAARDRREERGHLHATNQRQVLRVVIEDDDGLKHGDVDDGADASTRIVGPNGVRRRGHVDLRHTPNRTVVRAEGQTGRQAGVDGPRGDVARTGQRRCQWEVAADFTAGQGQVLRRVGHAGRQLVVDGDVEVGHA